MMIGPAAPAGAATANAGVYAIAPEWGGFCPDAGKVNNYATYVKYENHTTNSSGGDAGDDIVWMPVVLNQNNSVTISVTCRWSTPIGMNFTIKPTRNKQSWWFSIWGQTWKN